MKEEALKLADELIKGELIDIYEKYTQQWKKDKVTEASAMIRRLVEELDEKNYRILELTKRYKALTWNDKQGEPDLIAYEHAGKIVHYMYTSADKEVKLYRHPPQTKPLSNDDIRKVICEVIDSPTVSEMVTFLAIARAIEVKVRGQ